MSIGLKTAHDQWVNYWLNKHYDREKRHYLPTSENTAGSIGVVASSSRLDNIFSAG